MVSKRLSKIKYAWSASAKANCVNAFYYSTSLSRVLYIQITPKMSTTISVFVPQETGWTAFLQTSHMAENASFPKENKELEPNRKLK